MQLWKGKRDCETACGLRRQAKIILHGKEDLEELKGNLPIAGLIPWTHATHFQISTGQR